MKTKCKAAFFCFIMLILSSCSETQRLLSAIKQDKKVVFIPSRENVHAYDEWKEGGSLDSLDYFEKKDIKLTNAILELRSLPLAEIEKLLHSPYPNMRVYGYIYYVRKTQDLNVAYPKEALQRPDTIRVICKNCVLFDWYYESDIMLLIAFKGVDYIRLLPIEFNSLYGLTKEEKDELFELYTPKKPIHEYIDRSIRHFYSIDNTFIPSYQFDDVEE